MAWFDRDVDGFRTDVAHGLAKHPALPDGLDEPGLLAVPDTSSRSPADRAPHADFSQPQAMWVSHDRGPAFCVVAVDLATVDEDAQCPAHDV